MFRLLVSAGGTAGGVYPALAVVAALNEQVDVLWIGGIGSMEEQLVPRTGLRFEAIPAAGGHGVGLKALPGNLVQLAKGYRAARRIVRSYRPEAMLFTGGYVGVPVAMAGAGVPKVSYVPDLQPGLGLQVTTRLSKTVAVTAEASRKEYGNRRVVVTGYPTRPELKPIAAEEARQNLGLDPDRSVLLAFGGSQGARSINEALWLALPGILGMAQVLHITGNRDWPRVDDVKRELPERLQEAYHPYSYLHSEMGDALAAADLVISRAGAATLGEYPLYGLPAILVPYPHAWRYQATNARYLAEQGGAIVLNDGNLARDLLPSVRGLLQDPVRLRGMAEAMSGNVAPGAAEAIASEVAHAAQAGSAAGRSSPEESFPSEGSANGDAAGQVGYGPEGEPE
jgi:UDP-N-acetylglucosamine--N-acetylmuramyl-(pentapeptide) pyrophosphoryl-undecaprenol N-acetylglucosamine transferase